VSRIELTINVTSDAKRIISETFFQANLLASTEEKSEKQEKQNKNLA